MTEFAACRHCRRSAQHADQVSRRRKDHNGGLRVSARRLADTAVDYDAIEGWRFDPAASQCAPDYFAPFEAVVEACRLFGPCAAVDPDARELDILAMRRAHEHRPG